jgi:hypothetical protein
MKDWTNITGNALNASDSLADMGLTPESLTSEVARALRAYAVQMGYQGDGDGDEDEADYHRLAVTMKNEARAWLL